MKVVGIIICIVVVGLLVKFIWDLYKDYKTWRADYRLVNKDGGYLINRKTHQVYPFKGFFGWIYYRKLKGF